MVEGKPSFFWIRDACSGLGRIVARFRGIACNQLLSLGWILLVMKSWWQHDIMLWRQWIVRGWEFLLDSSGATRISLSPGFPEPYTLKPLHSSFGLLFVYYDSKHSWKSSSAACNESSEHGDQWDSRQFLLNHGIWHHVVDNPASIIGHVRICHGEIQEESRLCILK